MEPFDLRRWRGFMEAGGNLSSPAIVKQICLDSRRIDSPEAMFVALKGSQEDGHCFVSLAAKSGARFALVQKDWQPQEDLNDITLLRVDNPLLAFQEIAAAYRQQMPATVVGVTGSYGKTMLKDLLQTILGSVKRTVASPESFNSQIGVPLSLLTITKEDEIAIIEAGISQKQEMDILARMVAPNCGILTNIGHAHLHTLKDLKTTAEEKLKLFTLGSTPRWTLIPSDPILNPLIPQLQGPCYHWNRREDDLPHAIAISSFAGNALLYKIHFPDGVEYQGKVTSGFSYFLDLINIAIKAAWLLGATSETITSVLDRYHPEPMRTEIWKSPLGTTFINDTYCSDPQSVDIALRHLAIVPSYSRRVFAFGGMRNRSELSAGDFRRVGKAVGRSQLDLLILYGQHEFGGLVEEVNRLSPKTEICLCSNYQEAVNQMRSRIQHDDVVLIKGARKEPLEKVTEAFNDSICNNQCLINLGTVRTNLETIRNKLAPHTRIMVMVKALAYGTDDVRMAKFLASNSIDILGVSYVDEAVTLRRAGVTQSIFVINAALYEAGKVVKWDLEVGVNDHAMIAALEKEAELQNKKIKVHLHVDTGMSRFGCRPKEALGLSQAIVNSPHLILEGLMTHFASAENPTEDSFTLAQVRHFEETIQRLKDHGISARWNHASNSSAAVRFDFPQFNMVRIGLATYGLNASAATRDALKLQLALSLISRIVGINVCKKGETISYGRSYTVKRDSQRIAVLPIGYFDGLHRNYSGKAEVIVRGCRAPMVGKICMDFMMIDVTDIPDVQVGDSVLIFGVDEYGHYLSPETLAEQGDSIVHELITCLGPRIQRIFINE